jgi:hypothetical protein
MAGGDERVVEDVEVGGVTFVKDEEKVRPERVVIEKGGNTGGPPNDDDDDDDDDDDGGNGNGSGECPWWLLGLMLRDVGGEGRNPAGEETGEGCCGREG